MIVAEMLRTHPRAASVQDTDSLASCIEACFAAAESCTACADACLSEAMVSQLTRCITLDLDCADICEVTGRVLTRVGATEPAHVASLLAACADACAACAAECERHAGEHEHCRVCAEACRRCEEACRAALPA